MKDIVVAGGCFWGIQELMRHQPGVVFTVVGYTGGSNKNPTYYNHPGHAESIKITYDQTKTAPENILDYFFRIHDPTTLNQQGNDIGTSYRSAIFYKNDVERSAAEKAIATAQTYWPKPIVTSIEPLGTFYPAEPEHQDYLQHNPGGYTCHYERPLHSMQ